MKGDAVEDASDDTASRMGSTAANAATTGGVPSSRDDAVGSAVSGKEGGSEARTEAVATTSSTTCTSTGSSSTTPEQRLIEKKSSSDDLNRPSIGTSTTTSGPKLKSAAAPKEPLTKEPLPSSRLRSDIDKDGVKPSLYDADKVATKKSAPETIAPMDTYEPVPGQRGSNEGGAETLSHANASTGQHAAAGSLPGAYSVPGMAENNSQSVVSRPAADESHVGTTLTNEETKESEDGPTYEISAYAVEDDDTEFQRQLEKENEALRRKVQQINEVPVATAQVVRETSMKGSGGSCRTRNVIIAFTVCVFVIVGVALGIAAGTGSFRKADSVSTFNDDDTKIPTRMPSSLSTSINGASTSTPSPPFIATQPSPTPPTTPKPTFYQECWTKIVPDDGIANDTLGRRIVMHNDTMLIGASGESDNLQRGAAYVYVLSDDGTWKHQDKLVPQDNVASEFGISVGLYEDVAVVGARWDKVGNKHRGVGYVFVREGTVWRQNAMLRPDEWALGDKVGSSVAINSDFIVLGADGDDEIKGAAYVYQRDRDQQWRQLQKLVAPVRKPKGHFGRHIGLGPEHMIVGADGMNEVFIFSFNGTKWNQEATISAAPQANETKKKKFGYGASIDGKTLIVGAFRDDFGIGAAYVFTHLLNGTWLQTAKLTPSDGEIGDEFGRQVLIRGNTAYIGSRRSGGSGAAYIFLKEGDAWQQKVKLKPADADAGDAFGNGLASDNDILAISSFRDDDSGLDSGSFYSIKLQCLYDGINI